MTPRSTCPLLHHLPWLLVLASCASPPRPPTVDETHRRPANTAEAVELQSCRHELHNARQVARHAARAVEASTATQHRLMLRQAQLEATLRQEPEANVVYTLHFEHASSRVQLPADVEAALMDSARQAHWIVLRGRTDGRQDSPADSRIAKDRAEAVKDRLVGAGIDPARIRSTYQPSGDHAADNTTPAGRSLNRRVEIELYRTAPVLRPIHTTVAHP